MQSPISSKLKADIISKSTLIKQNLTLRASRKYTGSALTQNFFNSNSEETDYHVAQTSLVTTPSKEESPTTKPGDLGRSLRRSRRKFEQAALQPLKQEQRVEIFSRSQMINDSTPTNSTDDFEDISLAVAQKVQEKESEQVDKMVLRMSRRKSLMNQKREAEPDKIEQLKEKLQKKKEEEQKKQIKVNLTHVSDYLFFGNQSQDQAPQSKVPVQQPNQTKPDIKQQPLTIPQRCITHEFSEGDQNDGQELPPAQAEKYETFSKKAENMVVRSSFFNYQNEKVVRQEIFTLISQSIRLEMQIIRDNDGLNTFWPEFHMRFSHDGKRVISAKKTSANINSTFIISRNKFVFEEKSNYYMGKVKSVDDAFNIFGPGLSPSNARENGVQPRELLATLVYGKCRSKMDGPRRFSLYMLKPECSYYKDFPQVAKFHEEIPLNVLYSYPYNKEKICVYHNRKPKWIESAQIYQLDFRGIQVLPSIKNFILEDESSGQEIILFGKKNETTFKLDISSGISPYVAFALAIATFDNKIIFQ